MQFRITSVAPGVARLFFVAVPGNALIEDLTACPAIWQLWQETSTTFLLWFVPRYTDEIAAQFVSGWLSGQTGMMIRCASYAVLPPEAGLWIGSTVLPLFLTDQSQLNTVRAIPHIRQVECLDPNKGIFQVHTMPWDVNAVIRDIRTRLAELAATR